MDARQIIYILLMAYMSILAPTSSPLLLLEPNGCGVCSCVLRQNINTNTTQSFVCIQMYLHAVCAPTVSLHTLNKYKGRWNSINKSHIPVSAGHVMSDKNDFIETLYITFCTCTSTIGSAKKTHHYLRYRLLVWTTSTGIWFLFWYTCIYS